MWGNRCDLIHMQFDFVAYGLHPGHFSSLINISRLDFQDSLRIASRYKCDSIHMLFELILKMHRMLSVEKFLILCFDSGRLNPQCLCAFP